MSSNGRSAVELQSNGSRTAVESKSNRSCNRRLGYNINSDAMTVHENVTITTESDRISAASAVGTRCLEQFSEVLKLSLRSPRDVLVPVSSK